MPSPRSARIVYLDEVRAPATLPASRPPPSGRRTRSRIVLWLAVSLLLHALVLALPGPRQPPPASPPTLQPLDVVIVSDRAAPLVAPVPDRAREPPPSKTRSSATPAPRVKRSAPLMTPATPRPALPPVADVPSAPPASEPSAPPEPALPAPRGEAATAAVTPPAPPAAKATVTPPSFGAAYLANPPPAYPFSARRLGQSGLVVLKVKVSEAGKPIEVDVTKSAGVDALDRAAVEAVRGWTFVPARQGETPVAAWVEVPIRFRLADVR